MIRLTVVSALMLVACRVCVLADSIDAQTDATLYRSEQGAPPGYPGAFPETEEVIDKETGAATTVAKYPVWGQPELENYPGSVEHFRRNDIKYLPVVNPFNAGTLVHNWVLAADANAKREEFAEPIYYMPMYGPPRFTDRYRLPVKIVRLGTGPDQQASVTLTLGKLPPSTYALRLVAALDTDDLAWPDDRDPERLVLRCTINDGPDGAASAWTRRHRAVNQFYAVGEWYFNVCDDREFTATVTVMPESVADLLVYNIDLHDTLAGLPDTIIKTKATLYTAAARQAAQDSFAEHRVVSRDWGPNMPDLKGGKPWSGTPLRPDERAKRDRDLWNCAPPAALMNLQNGYLYGKFDEVRLSAEEQAQYGSWEVAFDVRYGRHWDQPRELINKRLDLHYTLDDYLAGKPLPAPFPFSDAGYGCWLEGRGVYSPVTTLFNPDYVRSQTYRLTGHTEVGHLCIDYFNTGNLTAARDAALLLVREALILPARVTWHKRSLQQVLSRPAQTFGFNDPVLRRQTGPNISYLAQVARAYDLLFDFIDGNQELAAAAGNFVPGLATPDDLRRFLDRRILHWSMRQVREWRVHSSHETPQFAIIIATVAQDAEATRPLLDWLFRSTWDYPLPLSGLQDYVVTGTTRDGTTSIGSFFYTAAGSPYLNVADMISTYIANGGDRGYNLADPQRYPKPYFGAYFNLEGRVAGYWPVGVGDVGGLQRPAASFDAQEAAVRAGWNGLNDPQLAWILKHQLGRKSESDQAWAAVEKAAATIDRNPWLANRSRALASWAGILESGTQHDDIRFRRAATVRVGVGWGHSHRDTLDLQLFALGCQMSPDGGQRPGYGRPDCQFTMNHNVVEVDGDGGKSAGNWEGTAWVSMLADLPGAPVLTAEAVPPRDKAQVRFARRTVALIDVDEGHHSTRAPSTATLLPDTVYPGDVMLPKSYVFDVYRVAGGQRHTYCFHGCAEDEFTVNADQPRRDLLTAAADDPDRLYLRKYILDELKGAGDAPDTVVATWRMAREPYTFEAVSGKVDEGETKVYKCAAPEPTNLGANYDPNAPRKFTRLHLLGQQGARLLWARWVSAPYTSNSGQWFTQLHAMHDGDHDRESVFAAIIETYDGTPAVAETTQLTISDNETDARRAVAVAVTTTNGHRDLLLADDRATARTVTTPHHGECSVTARFGYVSTDAAGLRQASITGGTELVVPGIVIIRPAAAAYTGRISKVDHLRRAFELESELPELAGNSFWEVGNDAHRTSLQVRDIKGKRVTFRKGLELVSTRVKAVDTDTGIVTGALVSLLMGAEEDNRMKPGMLSGLWATNDAMTRWWSCTYLDGSRATGYRYQLSAATGSGQTGAPVTEADFPIGGSLRIFELGPSDVVSRVTYVTLRRHPVFADRYELSANVPVTLSLPAAGTWEWRRDQATWQPLAGEVVDGLQQVEVTAEQLGGGSLVLKLK